MSWPKRLLYMCGQLGVMILARFFFQWLLDFSGESNSGDLLFSVSLVGLLVFVFRIFDGASDPIAGSISDSWVRRGGDRRKVVMSALIFAPLGLCLCFSPSFSQAIHYRWLTLFSGMTLFFLGYTFYAIPYWALIKDYSQGSKEEARILSNLLGVGLLLATAVGFIVSPMLVQSFGYFNASLLLASVSTVLMICPYFAAPEGMAASVSLEDAVQISIWQGVLQALKHKRFLAVTTIFVGSQMSLTVMTAAAPFIAVDLLGGEKKDVAFLMGPMLLAALPSFYISSYLSKRLGWQKTVVGAAVLLMLVYCTAALLGSPLIGTAKQTAMVVFALAGPMIAVLLGLEGEAVTECAEEAGTDSVSTYFGVVNLLVKSFNGVALFITGILADLASGEMGLLAIRAMVLFAGSCLLLSVVLYLLIRPKKQTIPLT